MANPACPAIIYQNARVVRQGPSIYFASDDYPEVSTFFRTWSRHELGSHIHARLGLSAGQRITKIIYRLPMGNTAGGVITTAMKIRTDSDVAQMFDAYDRASAYFQYVEVMVEVVDAYGAGEQYHNSGAGGSGAGPSTHVMDSETPQRDVTYADEHTSGYEQDVTYAYDQEVTYANEEPHGDDVYRNATELLFHTTPQENDAPCDQRLEDEEDDVEYAPSLNDDSDAEEDLDIRTSHGQRRRENVIMPFMTRVNIWDESDGTPNELAPMYNPGDPNAEISLGMTFADRESLVLALKQYCIRRNVDYLVQDSESDKYAGVCKMKGSGCKWRVRARLGKKDHLWKITRYEGPHTCNSATLTVDHRKLDSDFICSIIMRTIADNPGTTISQIISDVDQRYQYQPSYRKAWIAKQKAISRIFGVGMIPTISCPV